MARRIVLLISCAFLLAACGSSARSTSAPAAAIASSASSAGPVVVSNPPSSAQATSAAVPGCGQYCQQAGGSAGTTTIGYPCPSNGCLKCPAQNCITVAGNSGTVTNGVATVPLTCNLATECVGAVLLCRGTDGCHTGGTAVGGRIAGSDFTLAAGATSNVPIGLTAFGEQTVTANSSGYGVTVMIDMLDYGYVYPVTASPPSFTVTTSDPPAYPSGATASCGGTLFVGPGTSCPFAQNVQQAYASSLGYGNGTVTASSPVTGQTYQMQCTDGWPVSCSGGTNALVEFYADA